MSSEPIEDDHELVGVTENNQTGSSAIGPGTTVNNTNGGDIVDVSVNANAHDLSVGTGDQLDADSTNLLMDQLDELGDAFEGFEDIIFDSQSNTTSDINNTAHASVEGITAGTALNLQSSVDDAAIPLPSNTPSAAAAVASSVAPYADGEGMSLDGPSQPSSAIDNQKRKLEAYTSRTNEFENSSKAQRHDILADVSSNRVSGDLAQLQIEQDSMEIVPPTSLSLNRSVMKQLLVQLVGPLSASVKPFPSTVLDSLLEISRLGMEEVIREACVIREEMANGKDSAAALRAKQDQQLLNQPQPPPTLPPHHHRATQNNLTPSMIREAYRRLLNGGRMPSRAQSGLGLLQARSSSSAGVSAVSGLAGPILQPVRGASILADPTDEDPHVIHNKLKKQRSWRR